MNKMFKMGVFEPGEMKWAALLVFAPKHDGSRGFYVDDRTLSAVTARNSYPSPRMDTFIDSLGGALTFSTLEANRGYRKVGMNDVDHNKTAYTSHNALFRVKGVQFGLHNSLVTGQRSMDII